MCDTRDLICLNLGTIPLLYVRFKLPYLLTLYPAQTSDSTTELLSLYSNFPMSHVFPFGTFTRHRVGHPCLSRVQIKCGVLYNSDKRRTRPYLTFLPFRCPLRNRLGLIGRDEERCRSCISHLVNIIDTIGRSCRSALLFPSHTAAASRIILFTLCKAIKQERSFQSDIQTCKGQEGRKALTLGPEGWRHQACCSRVVSFQVDSPDFGHACTQQRQ